MTGQMKGTIDECTDEIKHIELQLELGKLFVDNSDSSKDGLKLVLEDCMRDLENFSEETLE